MYTSIVNNQDQALCHLFFHCCLEDDRFSEQEMDDLSGKLVSLGLRTKLSIKEELQTYRNYRPAIGDEQVYVRYLLSLIKPVNELALYSYCVELCIDDPILDAREEALLVKIGEELDIPTIDSLTINRLIAQRKAVEIQKIF
ncbi:MAG: TerB family tellurite resistance protein [Bacteroidetes bacterium]|nr:TerB family tellurite resistance protein [Bacteroidota bacterium]